MPVSTSPSVSGYLIDTNVLSLLAKAKQLSLLQYITVPLYITPTIQQEIEAGIQRGVTYLNQALTFIQSGAVQVLTPTVNDSQLQKHLPKKLGQGEAEAITICQRRRFVLITHDRRAINYCDRMGVNCVPLADLLAEFESAGVLTTTDVTAILTQTA